MKRVINLTDTARKKLWKKGTCPECSGTNVNAVSIQKRIRGYKTPLTGKEYTCRDCGCVNQFTGRGRK
jgi:RNase P subunit RPR2